MYGVARGLVGGPSARWDGVPKSCTRTPTLNRRCWPVWCDLVGVLVVALGPCGSKGWFSKSWGGVPKSCTRTPTLYTTKWNTFHTKSQISASHINLHTCRKCIKVRFIAVEKGRVGLLMNKDVVDAVLGCRPVSSRLISIRLRAAPFTITIIQVYAPTSGHDDIEVDHFYLQLQETIDQTRKKALWLYKGNWNAKVGKDAQADWGEVCGPYCNVETYEKGLRLLEFATFNNLVLTNTLGPHKPSRRWTWHSQDGKHHNQIDYILVKKHFRSGVNIHKTRSFPGADIGCDHVLVMMSFRVRLKKAREPTQPRLRFDLEKMRDPDVACSFQATIDGVFAPLIGLSDEDMDIDTMITTYNTAVKDAASEILGKERRRKSHGSPKMFLTSIMRGEI